MSTKTTQKTAETKKEFTLTPVLTMWIKKSKTGVKYLSGRTADGLYLKGFFNGKKDNPKAPDIRIFLEIKGGKLSKDEFISLWVKESKGGKSYVSGKLDDKWVTGFFNSKAEIGSKIPYLNVYFSDSEKKEEKTDVPEGVEEITTDDDELPFK